LDWVETAKRILTTRYLGHVFEAHEKVRSTNRRAMEWAASGVDSGAVVVADYQTEGRGRFGRSWDGGNGDSLLLSVVVRPTIGAEYLGLLPLAGGLAVVDSVRSQIPSKLVELKWPNDLLVQGRKCAGILVESVMVSGAAGVRSFQAVIGIGINVNQEVMPDSLSESATSLRIVRGQIVPRALLLAGLLECLEVRLDQLERDPESLVADYQPALSGLNREVVVSQANGDTIRGTSLGVDATGALRVWTEAGERVFTAADVTLSRQLN